MDYLNDLLHIGFTEYEAKVYLALLRDNPASGYQISKQSGVPRSMVYETLRRLHARGAVLESVEERATLYRPLPPDTLLDQHEQEHVRLVATLRGGLTALYNAPEEERAWSLQGRSTVLAYAAQMIERAQQEVYLVLNDADLTALLDTIEAACDREIDVATLLTGEATLNCGRVLRHPPLESELQGITGTLLVVADNTETLIASPGNSDLTATVTNNGNLVMIARQFVWMELFTQRIYARLGPELLAQLDAEDRQIFESLEEEG